MSLLWFAGYDFDLCWIYFVYDLLWLLSILWFEEYIEAQLHYEIDLKNKIVDVWKIAFEGKGRNYAQKHA